VVGAGASPPERIGAGVLVKDAAAKVAGQWTVGVHCPLAGAVVAIDSAWPSIRARVTQITSAVGDGYAGNWRARICHVSVISDCYRHTSDFSHIFEVLSV